MMIGGGPPKHDRVSDYEPAEPNAEELKRASVTLIGFDPSLIYLKCDACGNQWATMRPDQAETKNPYWICTNARAAPPTSVE
jgi:hypothetical protein